MNWFNVCRLSCIQYTPCVRLRQERWQNDASVWGWEKSNNSFLYESFIPGLRYKNTTVQGRFFGIQKVQKLLFCDQVQYWKEKIHNRSVPPSSNLETQKVEKKWHLVMIHKCKRSMPRYFLSTNIFKETVQVYLGREVRNIQNYKSSKARKKAQKNDCLSMAIRNLLDFWVSKMQIFGDDEKKISGKHFAS